MPNKPLVTALVTLGSRYCSCGVVACSACWKAYMSGVAPSSPTRSPARCGTARPAPQAERGARARVHSAPRVAVAGGCRGRPGRPPGPQCASIDGHLMLMVQPMVSGAAPACSPSSNELLIADDSCGEKLARELAKASLATDDGRPTSEAVDASISKMPCVALDLMANADGAYPYLVYFMYGAAWAYTASTREGGNHLSWP